MAPKRTTVEQNRARLPTARDIRPRQKVRHMGQVREVTSKHVYREGRTIVLRLDRELSWILPSTERVEVVE